MDDAREEARMYRCLKEGSQATYGQNTLAARLDRRIVSDMVRDDPEEHQGGHRAYGRRQEPPSDTLSLAKLIEMLKTELAEAVKAGAVDDVVVDGRPIKLFLGESEIVANLQFTVEASDEGTIRLGIPVFGAEFKFGNGQVFVQQVAIPFRIEGLTGVAMGHSDDE